MVVEKNQNGGKINHLIDIKTAEIIELDDEEIEKLQKSCKHERQKLKMTDKHEIRWFCEECDSMTKFATPEEIIQYLS